MSYFSIPENQKTAFDELLTAEPTPVVQLQFPYNINAALVESRVNQSGTVTQADGMAVITSGGAMNSSGTLLSRNALKYGPGQGALVRFTALFTTGVANSEQTAGIGTASDGLFFGYNGADFGILRREQGRPEIQTLTISSAAGSGTGNITVTLDGDDKVIALALDDTVEEIAVKIADADFSDVGGGWNADVHNATVIFTSWGAGNKTDSFTFDDTGTTGAEASFAETVPGVAVVNTWVAQTSWNVDTFDGNGPSGVTLDPTKGNVYQIKYQWLGFGLITFSIEDPDDGDYHTVHQIRYSNANTVPSLRNPTLPLCLSAKNTTNNSDLTVKSSSIAGFLEGKLVGTDLLNGESHSITNLGDAELPVLSLKDNLVHQGVVNRVTLRPSFISLGTLSTKPVIFRVRLNPTLTGSVDFTDVAAGTSVASVDKAASGLSGGREVFTVILSKEDSFTIPVHVLQKQQRPGDVLCVTAQAVSGANQEVSVSIVWDELF